MYQTGNQPPLLALMLWVLNLCTSIYVPFLGPFFYSHLRSRSAGRHFARPQRIVWHIWRIRSGRRQYASQMLKLTFVFLTLFFQSHCTKNIFDGNSTKITAATIPRQCTECVSPNGHFPNILFTERDESRKTSPCLTNLACLPRAVFPS